MSCDRIWHRPIETKFASSVHRFQELPWTAESIPRNIRQLPKQGIYKSSPGQVPPILKEIVSTTTTTSWFSPKPLNVVAQREDLALLVHVDEHDLWGGSKTALLSFLLQGDNLMIRNEKLYGDEWFLSFGVGSSIGSAALGWPLVEKNVGGDLRAWYPKVGGMRAEDIAWLCLTDAGDWQACRYTWRSPLWCRLKTGAWPDGLVAEQTTKADTLLKTSARAAFYNLGKTTIGHIARILKCPLPPGSSLYTRVRTLVQFVLSGP